MMCLKDIYEYHRDKSQVGFVGKLETKTLQIIFKSLKRNKLDLHRVFLFFEESIVVNI